MKYLLESFAFFTAKGVEQLGNFIMYGQSGSTGDRVQLYNSTGVEYGDGIFRVDVNPEKNMSIIRIERPTQNGIITLCEVEVYEGNELLYSLGYTIL
jgi:hypothetical protein